MKRALAATAFAVGDVNTDGAVDIVLGGPSQLAILAGTTGVKQPARATRCRSRPGLTSRSPAMAGPTS